MPALFTKLIAKLLGAKIDSASKLYRGIVKLDQQASEIRTVVTRVVSLVDGTDDDDINSQRLLKTAGFFYLGKWKISVGVSHSAIYGDVRGYTVEYENLSAHWCVTVFESTLGGYRPIPLRRIARIREDLPHFVDGMNEFFPSLAAELVSYFGAANV